MRATTTSAAAIDPIRRRPRHALRLRSAALTGVVALAALLIGAPAYATPATGGSGLYIGSIDWFQWGVDGVAIPSAGMTKSNTRTIAGKNLVTTCTLSGVSGNLSAYRSGDWTGDAFDHLYNIGGTGTSNTLVAGLVTTDDAALVNFTFACSVTYDGAALPMAGLVFADAESSTATLGEYIEATPSPAATWRIIDRARSAGCATSSIATLTAGGKLTLAPDGTECSALSPTGYGPAAVAFMQGATSAAVTLKGGGKTAVALGVVLESDYGDAPASYGTAGAFYQSGWAGGTVPVGSTNVFNGFTMATKTPPGTRLGATIDSEPAQQFSAGADGDGADEDAITPPGTLNVLAGTPYTLSNVACTGGYVRGWIDWNDNGVFDPGEASGTATCAGPSVNLTWASIPSDVVSASTYMRLRVADDSTEVANPTGMSLTGEVEDYAVTVDALKPIAAVNDSGTTAEGVPVTVNPLTNDTADADYPLVVTSVQLLDPADSSYKTTVTIPGEGTYAVQSDGKVKFTPVATFTGPATAVTYRVADTLGRTATATITITVTPVTPLATPDNSAGESGQPVKLTPLENDAPSPGATWDASTLCLIAPPGATSEGVTVVAGTTCAKKVTVADVGTWVVNPDGTTTFTSVAGYGGTTDIGYVIVDTAAHSTTSTMTVVINAVLALAHTGTDPVPNIRLAVLLLAAGALLTLFSRRPRKN